jgi:hypothetical protein
MHLMLRLLFALLFFSFPASAMQCDCIYPGAKLMKRSADLVFRGTIAGFDGPNGNDFAVFTVSRVWKGNISGTLRIASLEMPCLNFRITRWSVGTELLVFASGGAKWNAVPSDLYFPLSCGVSPVANVHDLKSLGAGRKPK